MAGLGRYVSAGCWWGPGGDAIEVSRDALNRISPITRVHVMPHFSLKNLTIRRR
jgi:hypothetical protein